MQNYINKDGIKNLILKKIDLHFGIQIERATLKQVYRASVIMVKDMLMERRYGNISDLRRKDVKTVYYMCMEFLLGRSLKNCLYNLGILPEFEEALEEGLAFWEREDGFDELIKGK